MIKNNKNSVHSLQDSLFKTCKQSKRKQLITAYINIHKTYNKIYKTYKILTGDGRREAGESAKDGVGGIGWKQALSSGRC